MICRSSPEKFAPTIYRVVGLWTRARRQDVAFLTHRAARQLDIGGGLQRIRGKSPGVG
jgi:hypothetical protein